MQVAPINNISISAKTNFKGAVDKSVVKYLDNACFYSNNPKETKVIANNILGKLTKLMEPLHKDTIFSVKECPVFEQIELPFSNKIASVKTGCNVYFTEFSNKTTNSRFSMSNHQEFIVGNVSKIIEPEGKFIMPFYLEGSLEQFETHVNALVDYFSVNKDVDRLLFNNMLKRSRNRFSILPEFIENFRQNRIEIKAKKIAKEFGMEPAKNNTSQFMKYEANDSSSNIKDAYTARSALL